MPTTCTIDFENNAFDLFFSGEILRGTVNLRFTSEKIVRGMYIQFTGIGQTSWIAGSDRESFEEREEYLNDRIYLEGSEDGQIQLAPGSYKYRFEYNLPSDLPSSFESKYGLIKYHATVVLNYVSRPTKEFQETFDVFRDVDLNADPALLAPLNVEESSIYNYACCLSRRIKSIARAATSSYVPGDIIDFDFNIDNNRENVVNRISVQLIQDLRYHVYSKKTHTKREFIVLNEASNAPRTFNVKLKIPDDLLPTDETNRIINIRYHCLVTAPLQGFSTNSPIEFYIPITIGTRPTANAYQSETRENFTKA